MAFVFRDDLGLLYLVVLTVALISFCYCMLASGGKGKSLLRFLGVTGSNSPPSSPHTSYRYTRRLATSNMLQRAVANHGTGAPKQQPLAQQLFSSSSPSKQQSPVATRQPNLGPNILQSRRDPNVNAAYKRQIPANHGVKRDASGVAKVCSGSFETAPRSTSRHDPIIVDENSPVKTAVPTVTQSEFFGEDDFDSDIELDVEDPTKKSSVHYPSLPRKASPAKAMFRPTNPRLQGLHTRDISPGDSGYDGSAAMPPVEAPPPVPDSSMPMSWPSSPPEHRATPPLSKNLNQFRVEETQERILPKQQPVVSQPARTQPVKRKTLPWMAADSQTVQAAQNGPPLPKPFGSRTGEVAYTPLPKDSKKALYPWNTTASAVKEQQKTLREVNKKKSKFTEASEQAMEIVRKKKGDSRVARVFLSEEQQHVLDLVADSKRSVFFTGSAGTGKSVLLREIISTLRKKHLREPDRVAVTASTGLAACNIGGVTLHSFAGIGLGKEDIPELVKKIRRNQKAKHRWMRTKILVVDEISMVDGDLFDKLEGIARQIRNNGRPFGGIQLIITGDFFQLPPVPDRDRAAKFAFDAASWTTSIEHTIGLHHVFRQKDPGRPHSTHFCSYH